MKALFLNDCGKHQVSSKAVTDNLTKFAADAGIELVKRGPHDIVIVNGEGTMHRDRPRAMQIHKIATEEKAAGRRVVLLNTVLQRMSIDLSVYDLIVAREGQSERFAKERVDPTRVMRLPDIAICSPFTPTPGVVRSGVLFIDSVRTQWTRATQKIAEENGEEVLMMRDWRDGLDSLLLLIETKELVVTGRFHGAILSMLAGTPFYALPSNTWKTTGLLSDFGISDRYLRDEDAVRKALTEPRPTPVEVDIPKIREQWAEVFRRIARDDYPAVSTKPPSVLISPGATCVAVGNGPSVAGSGLGKVIDSFDEVVRFNRFITVGHEADTGSKTTLWSTFGKGTVPQGEEPPKRVLFIHGESGQPAGSPEQIWRIPNEFYRGLQHRLQQLSIRPNDVDQIRPSSGIIVVAWLIEKGATRVHLVGFDHFKKERTGMHHYWNPKGFGRPKEHDGDAEAALLAEYARKQRVAYML